MEIFDIIFEKGSSKGKNKKNNEILQLSTDSRYLQSLALLSRKEKLLSIAYSTIVVIYTCFFVFVLGVLLSYFVCYVSMFLSLLVLYLSQPFVLKYWRSWVRLLSHDRNTLPLCTNLRLGCEGFHGEGVYASYFAFTEVMAQAKSFFDDMKKEIECPVRVGQGG